MKDFNILHSIRRSTGFSRGVAFLVIVAIVAIVAERTIYYVLEDNDIIEAENQVERIQQMTPHMAKRLGLNNKSHKPTPPSVEANFSQTAQGLKETLYKAMNKLGDEQVTKDIDNKLAQLHDQFQTMDKKIMQKFNETQQLITNKKLPDVIQARQDQAVSHYKKHYNELITLIEQVNQAVNIDAKQQGIKALHAMLDKQKFKRSQQPFDPNNLPNKSLKPDPQNKPKTTVDEFHQAGLYPTPMHKVAALGDFTYDSLPGANNPAYLAATDEVTLSQAIKDQAAALNYDPVKIHHWVRNNIEWQPAWGAVQNADLTLSAKRGNAMDIASLGIALLRASQIPARYVHGTIDVPVAQYMNWVGGFTDINAAGNFAASGGIPTTVLVSGGKIVKMRMEHVWVEAAIDFHPSRGAKNLNADSWVQMDGSYKQYEYMKGLDVIQISGLDPTQLVTDFTNSGTINETEGWATGFDPAILQNAQQQVQAAVENFINTNLPNAAAGDVIGGRKTIIKEYPTLPSSLSNDIVITGSRYDKLPAALQQKITFALGKDILGDLVNLQSFTWAKLNNERITLSFKPATASDDAALQSLLPEGQITDVSQFPNSIPSYLIRVIPELKVKGITVMTGSSIQLGEELDFVTKVEFVGKISIDGGFSIQPHTYKVVAGSYLSVNVIAGNVSPEKINSLQSRLNNTKNIMESNDLTQMANLNRENILGDMYQAGSLGYYAQYNAFSYIAGISSDGHSYLSAGRGTVGYEPSVAYFFGFPQSIEPGGVVFDIPIITATGISDGNQNDQGNFVFQKGVLSSVLEHATPEQMFITNPLNPPDAISAIKALSKASALGQRIYTISAANKLGILPNINHDASTMLEIANALASGKEVITHTDPVSIPGWIGAGYIIKDPITGDGAYKISGGRNGSMLGEFAGPVSNTGLFFISSLERGAAAAQANHHAEALKTIGTHLTIVGTLLNAIDLAYRCGLSETRALILLSTVFSLLTLMPGLLTAGGLVVIISPLIAFIATIMLGAIFTIAFEYLKSSVCKK